MKRTYLLITLLSYNIVAKAQFVENPTGTLTTTDNVGIGTTSPESKLEVEDVIDLSSGINVGTMELGVTTGTLYEFAGSQKGAGGDQTNQGLGGFGILSGSSQNSPIIWMYGAGDRNAFQVRCKNYLGTVQDGPVLFHVGANYRVGIGTTQPSAKLDVEGGDFYLGEKVYANGQRRLVRIYGYDNNSKFYGTLHSNYDDGRRTFDISSSSATNQLKIDASSNPNGRITLMPGSSVGVGIGTLETGSHKLAVEGSIGAREIKVEASGWSDFVFHHDYELRTLEEVEHHIAKNGHLPEIPCEAEVAENGINLGEMDAKLLQKIEELTLYLIEQNKRMNKLEVKNAELEKEISTLKNEVYH